ncbi:MAG: hypothetical protein J6R32_03315 [Bacteroidales bacterium]|nr:hypothetical protein [Bacteroidales bacterium]
MPTVNFGSFSKRRNSTKQPASLSDQRTVKLKETTSIDAPTFIITGDDFDYNYAQWGNRYYFITDIRSVHNGLSEIDCVLDPLATYKSEILASTQYVAYSSVSGGAWLADTRLPVLKSVTAAKQTAAISSLFNESGFYVLTCVGKDGCNTFAADITNLHALLDRINDWSDDIVNDIIGDTYDFSSVEDGLESLGQMMTRTGVVGNAYEAAPSCIRSCIWVPFFPTPFVNTGKELFLGQFDTGLSLFTLNASPVKGSITVGIPWHFSDWRRSYCEDVYLYLPLVGMVALASDNLVQQSSITVKYSATATDGCVCYQIVSGDQIIGSYGGQCSANYPIGISQQASAGAIAQTAFEGLHKTVNAGFSAASQLHPVAIAGGVADTAMTGIEAAYNTIDVAMSRNNSCIGGVGGGAGAGLDLNVTCYTVAHDTVINPSDMELTMGLPTMKPLQLSQCSGFCQCVNAHVEAPAMANELDAIDAMLNSGFYIE